MSDVFEYIASDDAQVTDRLKALVFVIVSENKQGDASSGHLVCCVEI